jgi:hypothetical protein
MRPFLAMLLLLLATGVSTAVEERNRQEAPSAVVRAYFQALLDGNYDETYDYLSSKRRNGMSRKDWVEQLRRQGARPRSEVVLMRVNPAIIRGEEATVVISLRLKTPEGRKVSRETYDLVREEGHWRIDGVKIFDAPTER